MGSKKEVASLGVAGVVFPKIKSPKLNKQNWEVGNCWEMKIFHPKKRYSKLFKERIQETNPDIYLIVNRIHLVNLYKYIV